MNPYKEEIIHAHAAIENWLSKGVGSLEALIARFAVDFTMITPGGICLIIRRWALFPGAARVSPGWLSWLSTLTLWRSGRKVPRCVIVSASNRQPGRDGTLVDGYFKRERGRIVWRHLHETTVTV